MPIFRIGFSALVSLVGTALFSPHWLGWVCLCLSFLVLFVYRHFLPSRMFWLFLLILFAHHITSLINVYGFPLPGAGMDAAGFHHLASALAQNHFYRYLPLLLKQGLYPLVGFPHVDHIDFFTFGFGNPLYIETLAAIYLITPSLLLGQSLSILAFMVACIFLFKITQRLKIPEHSALLIFFFFGLFPHALLWTSTTMTEPYQLCFLVMACYFSLCGFFAETHFRYIALCMSLLLFSLIHQGFFFIAIGMFILAALLRKNKNTFGYWLFVMMLSCLSFYYFSQHTDIPGVDILKAALQHPWEYIARYQERLHLGKHPYPIQTDFSSLGESVFSSLKLFLYYLFSPWPTQMKDPYLFCLGLYVGCRTILMGFIFANFPKLSSQNKRAHLFLLSTYCIITFIFALGTRNYGTAIRHQMLSDWIIFLLGIPIAHRFFTEQILVRFRTAPKIAD